MHKRVKAKVRMYLVAGSANPAPPVGSMLGPQGVNLMKFCTEFNNSTKDVRGEIVPVIVTVYVDKTFEIEYKTTPVTALIKRYAKISKGAVKIGKEKIGSITRDEALKIAEIKMKGLNTSDINSALKSIYGSAKSMGVDVV